MFSPLPLLRRLVDDVERPALDVDLVTTDDDCSPERLLTRRTAIVLVRLLDGSTAGTAGELAFRLAEQRGDSREEVIEELECPLDGNYRTFRHKFLPFCSFTAL